MDLIKRYYKFMAAKKSNRELHPPYTRPNADTIWVTLNKVELNYNVKRGGYQRKK